MCVQASSPPSSFPLHYLTTHCALLRAHCQLLTSCVALTTLPPSSPAILEQKVCTICCHEHTALHAYSVSSTACRYIPVSVQFQYCVAQFQSLADDLSKLYTSLFDADPATLQYISLYPTHSMLYTHTHTCCSGVVMNDEWSGVWYMVYFWGWRKKVSRKLMSANIWSMSSYTASSMRG